MGMTGSGQPGTGKWAHYATQTLGLSTQDAPRIAMLFAYSLFSSRAAGRELRREIDCRAVLAGFIETTKCRMESRDSIFLFRRAAARIVFRSQRLQIMGDRQSASQSPLISGLFANRSDCLSAHHGMVERRSGGEEPFRAAIGPRGIVNGRAQGVGAAKKTGSDGRGRRYRRGGRS
ncbi:hypothetical protein ACMAUO_06715 [Gluconacetobacter sp. Hr-1-5]|uniref:hypothetical protein n=1 Tax=Gluconacetobacter sp. Hr-1-5 TaxID=3395370 RepID=UPI003B52E510